MLINIVKVNTIKPFKMKLAYGGIRFTVFEKKKYNTIAMDGESSKTKT